MQASRWFRYSLGALVAAFASMTMMGCVYAHPPRSHGDIDIVYRYPAKRPVYHRHCHIHKRMDDCDWRRESYRDRDRHDRKDYDHDDRWDRHDDGRKSGHDRDKNDRRDYSYGQDRDRNREWAWNDDRSDRDGRDDRDRREGDRDGNWDGDRNWMQDRGGSGPRSHFDGERGDSIRDESRRNDVKPGDAKRNDVKPGDAKREERGRDNRPRGDRPPDLQG